MFVQQINILAGFSPVKREVHTKKMYIICDC